METEKIIDQSIDPVQAKANLRAFFIDILTDMESLKSLIYNGSDVAAYRNLQKISDKIKDKVREL